MAQGVSETPYTRDILRLAAEVPGRVGFGEIGDGVEVRSRTCGSRVVVAVELDEQGRVAALWQAVEACAFGQAAAAIMGRHAMGRNASEAVAARDAVGRWLAGDHTASTIWPELELLSPAVELSGRHGAIMLPFQALADAIREAER